MEEMKDNEWRKWRIMNGENLNNRGGMKRLKIGWTMQRKSLSFTKTYLNPLCIFLNRVFLSKKNLILNVDKMFYHSIMLISMISHVCEIFLNYFFSPCILRAWSALSTHTKLGFEGFNWRAFILCKHPLRAETWTERVIF